MLKAFRDNVFLSLPHFISRSQDVLFKTFVQQRWVYSVAEATS